MPKPFGSKPIALPARDALVLEWLGDGNVLDTNDGTKATLTSSNLAYADCPVGYQKQCGVFNGSSSRVDLGTFQWSSGAASDKTVMAAIYYTGASLNEIFTVSRSNDFFEFRISTENGIQLLTRTTGGSYPVLASYNGESLINRWLLVDFTWRDSDKTVTINLNNRQVATGSYSGYTIGNNNYGAQVGALLSTYNFFAGNIAGVRAFNRVLTDTERLAYSHEFNRQLGGGSDFGAYIPQPVFHCDWMGDSCDVANGKASTDTNVTQGSSDFQGLPRAALMGSSSKIVNGTSSIITSNNYTRWVIFKTPSSFSGNNRIMDVGNTNDNSSTVLWRWSDNTFRVSDWNGSYGPAVSSSVTTVASTWYCMAHVQTGTTAKIHVKPFGSARASNSGTLNGVTPGTDRIVFGSYYSGGDYFPGAIFWDAGIINSALSDSQIDLLFSECESGRKPYAFRRSIPAGIIKKMIGWYDGRGNYIDLTGNSSGGTPSNMRPIVRSGQGSMMEFNGSNSYVDLPASLISGRSEFSIFAKVRVNGSPNTINGKIFEANGSGVRLSLYHTYSTGNLEYELTGASSSAPIAKVPASKIVTAAICCGTSNFDAYVNGCRYLSGIAHTALGATYTSARMGQTSDGRLSRYFNGNAEAFFFGSKLSKEEVLALDKSVYSD